MPACPVSAIFLQEDLPEKWAHFAQINADWYAKGETASNETQGHGAASAAEVNP